MHVLPKAPLLQHGAQDQRVRSERDCNTCLPTRASPGLKLAWFGHVTRHDSMCKTVLLCTLEGGRRRDRQKK
ncbi:hypothetical protein DPMN_064107 [Dreissena polymorpha]|uniref:Uncharacterized protein n=1 Tax=Dreissena polymorpha TaxID=45954 RepID=A0A9D4HKV6_DREPO|nr:hypothetical protein DPMN_064107 [Dreissena polymorpha]